MPKFKPKKFLIRVLGGKSRNKEDAMDYLCSGFQRFLLEPHSHAIIREVDDEGDSMISITTMETVDNQPGTGRFIDKYIFQPMGRRIERLAMRFTIASLHPARIAQYIEADYTEFYPSFDDEVTLNDAIARLCRGRNGSTVVAGMKGLVKQTQSNSINRSATALAALVRVSLTFGRREFYVNVSRIEPIFHLETLAGSLPCSNPEKKWFLLLVKLAKETLIAVRAPLLEKFFNVILEGAWQLCPSFETAARLRQRLKRALEVYRSSGLDSLDDTIGEALAVCAEAVSACISPYARGDTYIHILETVYFTVIFILRSIPKLADLARTIANSHIYMVLQTLAYWVSTIVYRCLFSLHKYWRFDEDKMKAKMAFRSLASVCVYGNNTLVSRSLSSLLHDQAHIVLDIKAFPFRYQNTAKLANNSPVVQGVIESAKKSTWQLIRSFDKLEREVWRCTSQTGYVFLQLKKPADPVWSFFAIFGDKWWDYWKRTLRRGLMGNFSKAPILPMDYNTAGNRKYRRLSIMNNEWKGARTRFRLDTTYKWGLHLCTYPCWVPDWDWDIETSMERLDKLAKQIREGSSPPAHATPTSSPAVDLDVVPGESWSILAEEAHGALPKEVKIAFKTKDGKTQYTSFVPASPSPGHDHPIPESDTSGPSVGEQEIDKMEDGDSSSDASKPEAHADTPVEAFNNDVEGKETVCEARKGGDAISICSLD